MDIHKWLEETANAEAPHSPAQTPGAAFFQRSEKPRPVFGEKPAAKRSRSDSSLLDPQPRRRKTPPKRPKLPIERSPIPSADSEASHPSQSDSAESESSSHRYARKPRHKTRLERYEPKLVKERGTHVHQSRRGESKKTRRKAKRKRGEQSGSAIAEGFHAKNVSRDRLTLKPREQLGLFNKGRTSSAVRGRGLPDLVFSEMKFLQKEKDQPEPAIHHVASKKKRKKDQAQAREGEISAFFTSARPILAEKDGNSAGKDPGKDSDAAAVPIRDRDQSTKSSAVVPTIEGPYLGFGSRGPRHESPSYVSWSESAREPDVAHRVSGQVNVVERDGHGFTRHRVASTPIEGEEAVFKRPAPPRAERGTLVSSRPFRGSSVVDSDSHQRVSRSFSLPQHTSSPRRPNLVDCTVKTHTTDTIQSRSSMPPSVPVRARTENYHHRRSTEIQPKPLAQSDVPMRPREAQNRGTAVRRHTMAEHPYDATDVDPQTSSDLDAVIEQCNAAFQDRRRVSGARRRHTTVPERHFEQDAKEIVDAPRSHAERCVRFSGLERPSPLRPYVQGPSIYEQQAHRQAAPSGPPHYVDRGVLYSQSGGAGFQEGDDMLYDEGRWEEYAEDEGFHGGVELEPADYGMEDGLALKDHVQPLASDNSVVAPGFWRPNKLY